MVFRWSFAASLLAFALVSCEGNSARKRPVFRFPPNPETGAGYDPYVSDAPSEGQAATRPVTTRRVLDYYDPHYTAYTEHGFEPGYGSYSRSGEVYTETIERSPFFLEKSDEQTLPDAPLLEFDASASHSALPTNGGLVWVRANVHAPSFATRRGTGLNLALVFDLSESMRSEGKLELMKRGARSIITQLLPTDSVAIVTFDGRANVVVPSTSASDQSVFLDVIDRLEPGGGDHLGGGLHHAFAELRDGRDRTGHAGYLMLFSDGLIPGGGWRSIDLARENHGRGVRLNGIAVGPNADPSLLVALSEAGEGRFVLLDEARDVEPILAQEMRAIVDTYAKNVRLRVHSDGARVLGVFGSGVRNPGRGAKEVVLSDFTSGETRSVLFRIKIPGFGSAAHTSLRFELFFELSSPVRRTTLERTVRLDASREYVVANPVVEAHATIVQGFETMRKALDGEGTVYVNRTLEIVSEELGRAKAVTAAHADSELVRLAGRLEAFGKRFQALQRGAPDAVGDDWARLKRDFYRAYP